MNLMCLLTGSLNCKDNGKRVRETFFFVPEFVFSYVFLWFVTAQHALEQSKYRVNQLKTEIGPHMKAQAGTRTYVFFFFFFF
jgi:hypothetical protein